MSSTINELQTKALNDFIEKYKSNADSACSDLINVLFWLNMCDEDTGSYNHRLKHALFASNCIHNPLGVKYDKNEYEKTMRVFGTAVKFASDINSHNIERPDILSDQFIFNEDIINDCVDVLTYTKCFHHMNIVNTRRITENPIFQLPFVEQLLNLLVFLEDQTRIAKLTYTQHIDNTGITGMELSVANNSAEFHNDVNSSIADTFELNLESADEIIRLLYYRYKKKLKESIDFLNINMSLVHPYCDSDFQKYLYIAGQRHLLLRSEENIRYGYSVLKYHKTSEMPQGAFVSYIENDEKYRARSLGIYRREYQFRSNALMNYENQCDIESSMPHIQELANQLVKSQSGPFALFDLNLFYPQIDQFKQADRISQIKERIVETLTKKYYFDLCVNGVYVKDFICAYRYLTTISEVLYCASSMIIDESDQSTYTKQLGFANLTYLSSELTRIYGYSQEYAVQLIDRFVFHETDNNKEDIFARPLIKISKTQVILCYATIDQVNLDRAIEKQFIQYNKDISEVGHIFEKEFKQHLKDGYTNGILDFKKKPIPNLRINTNKIEYEAFDHKNIEFDIVLVLDDYLILTELKSLLTSYDVSDLSSREKHIKEAVEQLQRRAQSVRYDWEKFKSKASISLPEQPFDSNHIILVACSDAFDYTPLQYENVYITDDSTYLKYFTSPYVESMIMGIDEVSISSRIHMWKKGFPDACEFVDYLVNPVNIHPFVDYIEKSTIPIPRMDKDDEVIFFEEYQLKKDPIFATIFGRNKENTSKEIGK